MGTEAMQAAEALQATITAREKLDALIYGQRTLEAMGGRAWGISVEFGAPEWALAQWEAASDAAAEFGLSLAVEGQGSDRGGSAAWNLKRAKKMALEAKGAADAALKSYGTQRQFRLALAA